MLTLFSDATYTFVRTYVLPNIETFLPLAATKTMRDLQMVESYMAFSFYDKLSSLTDADTIFLSTNYYNTAKCAAAMCLGIHYATSGAIIHPQITKDIRQRHIEKRALEFIAEYISPNIANFFPDDIVCYMSQDSEATEWLIDHGFTFGLNQIDVGQTDLDFFNSHFETIGKLAGPILFKEYNL